MQQSAFLKGICFIFVIKSSGIIGSFHCGHKVSLTFLILIFSTKQKKQSKCSHFFKDTGCFGILPHKLHSCNTNFTT